MKQANSVLAAIAVSALLLASFAFIVSYDDNECEKVIGDPVDHDAEGYIPISSAADLARVGTGDEYPSGSGIFWGLGEKYYLTGDITLTGPHVPIGAYDDPFTGIFDGNGNTISGMIASAGGSVYVYAGLFGCVYGAEVRGVTLEGGSVTVSSADDAAFPYVGSIAGFAAHSTIADCYNACPVSAEATSQMYYARSYVGGFAGHAEYSVIQNCVNDADISAVASSSVPSQTIAHAGGIVGVASETTITDCKNSGNIEASADGPNSTGVNAGGIAGVMSVTEVTGCENTGSVHATARFLYIGGICGYSEDSAAEDCSNSGAITAEASAAEAAHNVSPFAGGVIGMANSTPISGCYNTGPVRTTASVFEGTAFSGGILGGTIWESSVMISQCYNTGDIESAGVDYANAGGIVGSGNSFHVSECYNTGTVKATAAVVSAGGIAGGASHTSVADCYNLGSVTAAAAGLGYAGGVLGNMHKGAVSNCYSTGTIEGSSETYVGGISGSASWDPPEASEMTFTNCYFLEGTADRLSGLVTPMLDFDSLTVPENSDPLRNENQFSGAKSAEEMAPAQDDALAGISVYYTGATGTGDLNIAGWDFENVWIIVPEENSGRPILRAFYQEPEPEGPGGDDKEDDGTGDGGDEDGTGDGEEEEGDDDDKTVSFAPIVLFIAFAVVLLLLIAGAARRK
jgi:hypothetical protein